MLNPPECLGECVARLGAEVRVFYDLRHQVIYGALVAMGEANQAIDVITVQQWLKDRGQLEAVGGIGYLSELPDGVPSAANLSYYLAIVWEKWLLRRLLGLTGEVANRVMEFEGNVPELLDEVEADILAVNEGPAAGQRTMVELVASVGEQIEHLQRGVGLMGGIRTHFGYLDKMTGGFRRKQMIVIAARPSVGKTSWMLNIARNVALLEKVPVGIFTLEMTAEELVLRLICAEAEVDFHKLRTGFPEAAWVERLARAGGMAKKLPIHLDETPALGILELRARARRMVSRHGVGLIMVDYLQLMHGKADYRGDRQREVADISGGLKGLAKELDVAVVAVSQLNREVERTKHRKPQLADLRDSGAIEQDADVAMLLYRPKEGDGDDEEEDRDPIRVNALIAKQRNGPTGDVELLFHRWKMQMVDAYENRGARVQPELKDRKMPTSEEMGIKPQDSSSKPQGK